MEAIGALYSTVKTALVDSQGIIEVILEFNIASRVSARRIENGACSQHFR